MIRSFRLQITAWYLLLFSLLFLLFSAFLHTLLSRALQNRLDQALSEEVNTTASLFQSELDEMNGDPVRAAIETVSEMRLRNVLLAIFEGRRLLASSAPLKGGELSEFAGRAAAGTQPELLLTLPNAGPNGSRAVAYRFALAGRTYVMVAVQPLDSIAAALQAARHAGSPTVPSTPGSTSAPPARNSLPCPLLSTSCLRAWTGRSKSCADS